MRKLIKRVFKKISGNAGTFARQDDAQSMWSAPYHSWAAAENRSLGYDAENIFLAVKRSALAVKNGEYPYERDSVLFEQIEYAWPLLSILQHIAIENNNSLTLIDFGGGLGSTYFQNRKWLANIDLKWIVVEQELFVSAGKQEFEDGCLVFENTLEQALRHGPHAILFSSVLQYLNDPTNVIKETIDEKIEHILIDRTSFAKDIQKEIFTVQTVPKEIYEASYPCRFFKEDDFLKQFTSDYHQIVDFPSYCDPSLINNGITLYWKGYYFKRK